MYSLFRSMPLRSFLVAQMPTLVTAFVIAEMFYKFKSFTLECLAFLVTWTILDFVVSSLLGHKLHPVNGKGDTPA